MEDLLLEWHNNLPEITPEMSLQNQATYLSKKYEIKEYELDVIQYDRDSDDSNIVKENKILIRFKDIVCKYRPHLQLGDYWLSVNIVDSVPNYHFYTMIEPEDGNEVVVDAVHPHLSSGIPCLGSFQGDLQTAFTANNFIQFFSIMRAYLSAYNGRSTYSKGLEYKIFEMSGHLQSYEEIRQIFSGETENELNATSIREIAYDPMRWNWPKDLTAWTKIEIKGQERHLLKNWVKKVKYPVLKDYHSIGVVDHGDDQVLKVLGYVKAAIVIGELPLYQAFEFVRIFLMSLQVQYEGDMSPKVLKELKEMATILYATKTDRSFRVNTRYTSRIDDEHYEKTKVLWSKVKRYYVNPYSNRRERNRFGLELKYLGHHLSNFLILLRKKSPHLASAKTYLNNTKESINEDEVKREFSRIKKHAYNIAIQQLEKDKRRFINELNRPEISNIPDSIGQGTLFSENI